MLTHKIVKKISILISVVIIIFIINIFPKRNSINYEVNALDNINYIYLLDSNNYISCVDIKYLSNSKKDLIYEIHDYLTVNTNKSNMLKEGFYPIIPEDTTLLNYSIDNDILLLNYSKNLLNISSSLEEKMLESIIYTYTELSFINKVSIKVNNEYLSELPHSHKKINNVLDRSFKINKKVYLNKLYDVKETVIYYLAKQNNNIYYLPVTKYTNDYKEKIDIIIEELKSSSTYNNNLINYLKMNVTLSNYEIEDNFILLNFSNIKKDELTEEITYAINSSIKENYNVSTVIYYIDNVYTKSYSLL